MNTLLAAAPIGTDYSSQQIDWVVLAPIIAMFGAALAIVLLRAILRTKPHVVRNGSIAITFVGIATAFGFVLKQWQLALHAKVIKLSFADAIVLDGFGTFVQGIVLIATALGVLIALGYLRREGLEVPEYLTLLLLSATGMIVMAHANDLILIFVALEVFSIALYILAAFDRRRSESQEAGLKYFVLGAFSSAIFLYGIALTYGATGTTSISGIASFLRDGELKHTGLLVAGFALLLVGLAFKVSAAPFHMWTPDVYEGAPTPVTTFMAAATKVAAFAAFFRIFAGSFATYSSDWRPAVYVLAVVSLVVGTIAAAIQTDVKRMLAYSSVAHAGYILIGVQVANAGSKNNEMPGTASSLFYLLVYALMAIGAFGVVQAMNHRGDTHHALSDYKGLSRREPLLAGLLALFLLAQAGVPFTGGFIAKLSVFRSAVDAGQYQLAIAGMLAAVIGAFVYLRLVMTMYASGQDDRAPSKEPRVKVDAGNAIALAVTAVAILVIGVAPNWFLDIAHQATQYLS